jgi:hypothetical protein
MASDFAALRHDAVGHNPPPALQKMIGRRSTITMMKIWPTLPGMPLSEVS